MKFQQTYLYQDQFDKLLKVVVMYTTSGQIRASGCNQHPNARSPTVREHCQRKQHYTRKLTGFPAFTRLDFRFRVSRERQQMKRNAIRDVTDSELEVTESYTSEVLRSTKDQNQPEQTFFCEYCFKTCFQNARGTKHYCSNACKQRALRARQGRGWQDESNREDAAQKTIETKRNQLSTRTCPQCGMYFYVNGLQHSKRFCSPACKVAYHRRVSTWREEWKTQRANDQIKPIAMTDEEKIYQAWSGALENDS